MKGKTLQIAKVPVAVVFLTLSVTHGGCRTPETRHASSRYGEPLTEEETLPYRQCESDGDCVYVKNGCCDCGSHMRELSVNKTMKNAFDQRMTDECAKGTICPDSGRLPDCGTGGNVCVNHLCQYQTPFWDQGKRQVYWEFPKGVRHYREVEEETEQKPTDIENDPQIPGR